VSTIPLPLSPAITRATAAVIVRRVIRRRRKSLLLRVLLVRYCAAYNRLERKAFDLIVRSSLLQYTGGVPFSFTSSARFIFQFLLLVGDVALEPLRICTVTFA
jgi:hypothetical protein